MSRLNELVKNIGSNWIAFATSILTAFFLSPFIVHHLGDIAYGVWTLVISLISLLGLLDLGMRGQSPGLFPETTLKEITRKRAVRSRLDFGSAYGWRS